MRPSLLPTISFDLTINFVTAITSDRTFSNHLKIGVSKWNDGPDLR